MASCRPHTVPSPAPSSPSDTLMQCIVETVYRYEANGMPMLSSSWLDALMSTIRSAPAWRSAW